jgi:hypothetical protein
MGCIVSLSPILQNFKRLTPYTTDDIAKHGPNLIGTEVHVIGYVGLRNGESQKHVVYSPFNKDEYGVYIKINVYQPGYNGAKSKKKFSGKAGTYFTVHNNQRTEDVVVISMENPNDWQINFAATNKHYNIECADHSMNLLRAGGDFDGNRNGIKDRPDLKSFWETFQCGKDPLHLLQTGADKYFGGRPRNASEYILHLNEVVSIVGILEKDPNTNQYILLPTAKQIEKKKIKVGGITTLHKYSPSLKTMESIINDEDENDENLIMVSMSDVKNGKTGVHF